jgi:hypothetical protein
VRDAPDRIRRPPRQEGDEADPEQHPIAIALRRQRGVDDAKVSKRKLLIRRGEKWFRYGAPKRVS